MRQGYDDQAQIRKRPPRSRRRLRKEPVTRKDGAEAGLRRRSGKVSISKGLPAAILRCVTVDLKAPQQFEEMDVQVCVKQPHGRSR